MSVEIDWPYEYKQELPFGQAHAWFNHGRHNASEGKVCIQYATQGQDSTSSPTVKSYT
jgi:hypothetical protein